MLYGISELPEIIDEENGKPAFRDENLPRFSISYAGNIVGVALSTEGDCGLIWNYRTPPAVYMPRPTPTAVFNSNERVWISNQHDPDEARAQLDALRKSVMKLTGENAVNLQLLPGSGRLRTSGTQSIEAVCDAETVLVWSIAASPDIGQLKVWEYNGKRAGAACPTRRLAPKSRPPG